MTKSCGGRFVADVVVAVFGMNTTALAAERLVLVLVVEVEVSGVVCVYRQPLSSNLQVP